MVKRAPRVGRAATATARPPPLGTAIRGNDYVELYDSQSKGRAVRARLTLPNGESSIPIGTKLFANETSLLAVDTGVLDDHWDNDTNNAQTNFWNNEQNLASRGAIVTAVRGMSGADSCKFRDLHTIAQPGPNAPSTQDLDNIKRVEVNPFHFKARSGRTRGGLTTWIRVFDNPSRINHSCEPNATYFARPNGQLDVVAVRIIRPGDDIEINYIDWAWLQSFASRQRALVPYGFNCDCPSCATATRANGNTVRTEARNNRTNLGLHGDPATAAGPPPAPLPNAVTRQLNAYTYRAHVLRLRGNDQEWVRA
jgi:hypothetical protein